MANELARNHEIEKIYMEQLRNAETAVYVLNKKWDQTDRTVRQLRTPIARVEAPRKPEFRNYFESANFFIAPVVLVILFLMYLLIDSWLSISKLFSFLLGEDTLKWVSYAIIGAIAIVTIVGVIRTIFDYKRYKKSKKEYEATLKKNAEIDMRNAERTRDNRFRAERMETTKINIRSEYNQAVKLRDSLYSINWIPSRYRDIRVVYYICDMVNSSNIGIEEALKFYLLQEANNKLDELLKKMDDVIAQQNTIIMNQAVLNSKNDRLIAQNKTIIEQGARIEENTRLSAEYSQLGAQYAEANAYFSLATYLKN